MKVSTVVGGLAIVGSAVVGFWINAQEAAIDRAEKATEQLATKVDSNATAIRDLTILIRENALRVAQNQTTVQEAADNARANRESLIRIEQQLRSNRNRDNL